MSYERKNIERMAGYVPGEQPGSVGEVVKLNTNENPYPPCDGVMEAMRGVLAESLQRYPNPTARAFREVAAKAHGVGVENIIATNGGDELLRLVITTFDEPGRPIGTTRPSYSLYPVLASVNGSEVVEVELGDDWSLPIDFAMRMNGAGVQVAFIVNPHAPSGRLFGVDELAGVAGELEGVLLIDEAYVDFVDPELGYDATGLIERFDNVILLRSLSKGYSLAGMRFGYGIGSAGLIGPMQEKTKDSYNTDAVSQAVAVAAIENRDAAAKTWLNVRKERARLALELGGLGFECWPSESNFVLSRVEGLAMDAKSICNSLKGDGIFVRYFDEERLRDCLRITVGTAGENGVLLKALAKIIRGVG